jgi:hypothetical protein
MLTKTSASWPPFADKTLFFKTWEVALMSRYFGSEGLERMLVAIWRSVCVKAGTKVVMGRTRPDLRCG